MADDLSLQIARKHVDEYVDRDAALMRDHQEAMECRNCETLLRSGIKAFKWLSRSNVVIRRASIEGLEVSQEVVDSLENLFKKWLEPCGEAEEWIEQQHARGYEIANLSEFRKACEQVRRHNDIQDALIAIDEAQQGEAFGDDSWVNASEPRAI